MKTPKPITALKALLLGADIKLSDGYTYRYDKGDEEQGPRFCIVTQMSNELGNYEECTIGSDLTLQQFIQLCEQMTEEQWVAICATCALTLERLERQEKREQRHDEKPCRFDKDGQCGHADCIQVMSCHRQNCPWPARQTGLGSDIWWKGREGDWEQKKP